MDILVGGSGVAEFGYYDVADDDVEISAPMCIASVPMTEFTHWARVNMPEEQ